MTVDMAVFFIIFSQSIGHIFIFMCVRTPSLTSSCVVTTMMFLPYASKRYFGEGERGRQQIKNIEKLHSGEITINIFIFIWRGCFFAEKSNAHTHTNNATFHLSLQTGWRCEICYFPELTWNGIYTHIHIHILWFTLCIVALSYCL